MTVIAFYQNRNLAPLWLEKGLENARAELLITRLKNASSDGLDPSEYRAPKFAGLASDGLAEVELNLTHALLTYARHLQAGRFPYARVSRNIELPQVAPEPADILNSVANAADAGKVLNGFSPQQEPYRKLKAMLAELRSKSAAKGETSRQIETIIANMERWRWYPRDLGGAHVLVNLPDFTLKVMHNGAQAWTTRIVIGKPGMPTPLLSETMKYITVNPTWHVPQSIV
jgi:murein L,D-transpeptidase YcbB/YkuD